MTGLMGGVDLLDTLRAFGVPHMETEEDFIKLWMAYGNAQERFDLFYELDEWRQQYGYYGIYDFIGHHTVGFGARVRERPPQVQVIEGGR